MGGREGVGFSRGNRFHTFSNGVESLHRHSGSRNAVVLNCGGREVLGRS